MSDRKEWPLPERDEVVELAARMHGIIMAAITDPRCNSLTQYALQAGREALLGLPEPVRPDLWSLAR